MSHLGTSKKTMNRCFQHLREAMEKRWASIYELQNSQADPKIMGEAFAAIMHELGEYTEMNDSFEETIFEAGYEWRTRVQEDGEAESGREEADYVRQNRLSSNQMGL